MVGLEAEGEGEVSREVRVYQYSSSIDSIKKGLSTVQAVFLCLLGFGTKIEF